MLMYIIEAIPIGKGVLPESLSYFSHTAYARGTLLQIPVRKRVVPAIVTSSIDAFSMKTALRAATFSLRKLPAQEDTSHLSIPFFETAEEMASYHATTINAVLAGMLPKEMREGTIALSTASDTDTLPTHDNKPCIFSAPTHERFNEYKRMVRESFAARKTVVCVAPTLEYIEQCTNMLSGGIEVYTVILHSGQTLANLTKAYAKIAHEEHPLLIITTPPYACIERSDIGTYILEHERSQGYIGKTRPYLDYRHLLTIYTAKRGCTLILADTLIRTEEIYALETQSANAFTEISKRLELPGTLSVLLDDGEKEAGDTFSLLSPELTHALSTALKQKKHVFLFSARRGLSPLVMCIDCKHILRDPESGAPLALSRSIKDGVESRWLTSAVSGYRVPAFDLCPSCGSWRLRERGIGIQQVYDELIKHYDRESVTIFDHQTASTHKKASTLRTHFYAKPGGILLGTALALPYLTKTLDMSAIISHDSLRAIPSWRQEEEMFGILMTLREKTHGTVYVQTRTDDEIFSFSRHGSIHDFYTQELETRKAFQYPPYATFIHLAWREKRHVVSPLKKILTDLFAESDISLYSSFDSTMAPESESVVHYGLIRVPAHTWPDEVLARKLRTLPPSVRILINPDRIV